MAVLIIIFFGAPLHDTNISPLRKITDNAPSAAPGATQYDGAPQSREGIGAEHYIYFLYFHFPPSRG